MWSCMTYSVLNLTWNNFSGPIKDPWINSGQLHVTCVSWRTPLYEPTTHPLHQTNALKEMEHFPTTTKTKRFIVLHHSCQVHVLKVFLFFSHISVHYPIVTLQQWLTHTKQFDKDFFHIGFNEEVNSAFLNASVNKCIALLFRLKVIP